jgi:hypothetical protein
MRHALPLAAIHKDGTVELFDSLEALHPHRRSIHLKHREVYSVIDGEMRFAEHDWIVRDGFGAVVDPDDIPYPPRRKAFWARGKERARIAEAAGVAIPGTGRSHGYRYHRRFAYMGDNRAAAAIAADLTVGLDQLERRHLASLRQPRLVDGWDGPNRCTERCWKDQRRTQWR